MKRWIGVLVFCVCNLLLTAQTLDVPVMDSIKIINGKATLYWSPVAEAQGYYIYWYDKPKFKIFDTVYNATPFTDTVHNSCDSVQTYTLQAFNNDGNNTSLGVFEIYLRSTVKLELQKFDNCAKKIGFTWENPYPFPGLNGYELYRLDKGDTVLIHSSTALETSWEYTYDFKRDSNYYFLIRAVSDYGKFSLSCEKYFTAHYPPKPDVLDVYSISVYQNRGVSISCLIDSLKINGYVGISREAEDETGYTFLGYIPVKGDTSVVSGWDSTARVNDKWYRYAMVALDSCFIPYLYDTANSIHLGGKAEDSRTNFLHWNAYQSSSDSVIAYLILRKIPGFANSVIQLPADSLLYYDRISLYENLGLKFDYLVQAEVLSRSMLNDGIADSLQYRYCNSNSIVIFQNLKLFLPNAFRPGGMNPKFSPGDFIKTEISNFRLTIFNRWGQQLYTTTEQSGGWDGRVNGEDMPTGVYVYVLSFTTQRGNTVQQKGTVTLVR